VLLKVLDVRGRFSVQVHPDEAAARARGGDPKTEAWIVLEAEPGARIWRGLREETPPAAVREAIEGGRLPDLLHSFEPKAGDVVLVPAGTIHAAGDGLVLAEIQQSSETTHRLWDWGRGGGNGHGRALQVDLALEAARLGPAGPDRVVPREIEDDGNLRRLLLLVTKWFEVEHVTAAGTATFEAADGEGGRWWALLFLSGSGTVRAFRRGAEPAPFRPGDTVLLPAGHDHFEIEPADGKVVQALAFREAE
jgi:mannose-6-phosphate isomerase